MKILITGGTGFIGRHLTPYLLEQGAAVALLLREEYGARPLPPPLDGLRPRLEIVYADLRNYNLTRRALRQATPQGIIHLAAAGVTDPFLPVETALRHNVNGTINLLRAGFERGNGVSKCLIARTPGEESAMNVYAASKAAAWQFCQMYAGTQGWPIVGATIFQAYGPRQPERTLVAAALRAAQAGEDFPMTAGAQERDWIYVSDVAAGLTAALQADLSAGDSVHLGTGQTHSLLQVVEQIYALVDKGGRPRPGALPARPGEAARQVADIEKSRQLIGWRPEIDLTSGLRKLARSLEII